jgi:hypothetical protein
VPQVYTYAPLLAAFVLWSMLTVDSPARPAAPRALARERDDVEPEVALSAL